MLTGGAAARQTLSRAAAPRPAQMPNESPLNAVADYLAARLQRGDQDGLSVAARASLARQLQPRNPPESEASLGVKRQDVMS